MPNGKPFEGYSCEEVVRRLDFWVDRELRPHEFELLEAHLETCASCAVHARFARSFVSAIKERVRRIAVPPGLESQVKALLEAAAKGEDPNT